MAVVLEPKRCGRTRTHRRHTWVTTPAAVDDYDCDGRVGPRPVAQLVAERPLLAGVRGAGIVLIEGAMSA